MFSDSSVKAQDKREGGGQYNWGNPTEGSVIVYFYILLLFLSLSNDLVKVESIFVCYASMCFPHIRMFSFSHRECINLKKGRLRNKKFKTPF